MVPEPRVELRGLRAVPHGGGAGPGVLDFSTGVSPLPTPSEILAAARDARLDRYPHPTALPFRAAVATPHEVRPEQIVAGAGSVELIWALARAFAGGGRAGLVEEPAFGEYRQALQASGATVVSVRLRAPGFASTPDALDRALAKPRAQRRGPVSLVFLCRPSNPCLTFAPRAALVALARRWPRTLFVVDEAYQPLFDDVDRVSPRANVAVLRSLTKVFALPGLRLGYLVASRAVARAVQAALPPWNVSSAAQAAGVVAARLLPSRVDDLRARTTALRRSLERKLAPVAGPPRRSGGPFLLYDVGPGRARALARRLLDRGVMVRDCTSFGLPDYVRLGVRADDEHDALVRAWGAVGDGSRRP